jgi:hypothetical protein
MLFSFSLSTFAKKIFGKLVSAWNPWLGLVLAWFAFFAWASWGKVEFPLIDVGREVEISSRLLTGQLLYRDVETYYGPLAYYANALALKLFGHHLDIFFAVGTGMGLLATGLVYHLAQSLTNRPWAALCAICFTTYCALGPGLYNFILPYSYGGVYASILGLLAITCFHYYPKEEQPRWLVLAGISCGLAGIAKQEYGVAALGGILISVIFYSTQSLNIRIKNSLLILFSAILSAILPLAWLAHYVSWPTLLAALFPIAKANLLSQAPMFQNTLANSLLNSWISFRIFLVSSLVILGTLFAVNLIIAKLNFLWLNSRHNKNITQLIAALAISQALLVLLSKFVIRSNPASIFHPLSGIGWFPWFLIGYVIICAFKKRTSRYNHNPTFWAILFFSLILNARWSFYVKFHGLYALPVILVFFALAYHISLRTKTKFTWYYLLICLLISFMPQLDQLNEYHYKVSSSYGAFYTKNEQLSYALNKTIKTVGISKEKHVLILPEGNIINFLTATHSPSREITFLPHTLPAEEDQRKFLSRMEMSLPKIIVYADISFHLWGYKNYAQFNPLVYQWIIQNYKLVESSSTSEGTIKVYTQSSK